MLNVLKKIFSCKSTDEPNKTPKAEVQNTIVSQVLPEFKFNIGDLVTKSYNHWEIQEVYRIINRRHRIFENIKTTNDYRMVMSSELTPDDQEKAVICPEDHLSLYKPKL